MKPIYFLLVDDLEENLLALEALLRRDNLILLKARSGMEALELLLQYDVALALLDVQMPHMDGFELAELMRGTERTRRVPIIFVTAGTADRQRRFRGYEAGAVDFIHKPIEPDILRSKAEVFFELHRQRDEIKQVADENARLLNESRRYTEALKEADRRKDEFLATLAHELRNPLAPIQNGLQILCMSPEADAAEKVRDIMQRQLRHLIRLIEDLLDVARVSQGKIDLRQEKTSLESALQAAIEASKPLIDAHQHTLNFNMPPETLWVNADLTRLAQIVSNLLNNAAKYTPDEGQITLDVYRNAQEVIISVSDNGRGIPHDMLPKVFDLFTQVDRSLDHSQGGLGIGLALVKRLVEMHDGTVEAKSPGLGQGSTFSVHLPLFPGDASQAEPAPSGEENVMTTSPLRVLVVDDNAASAQTTGWMLEMVGHEAKLAYDGNEALDIARKIRPDVVMLDIGLPGMNGYDVCREIRKDPFLKSTILIAQTGWGQERDRRQAFDAGFDHHLTKPVKFDDFLKLLSTIKTGDISGRH